MMLTSSAVVHGPFHRRNASLLWRGRKEDASMVMEQNKQGKGVRKT